jgi:hypothetical protein
MVRKLYSLFFLVFICSATQAQISTKLDLRLFKRLQQGKIENKNMPLLVRGEESQIQTLTEKFGGVYKYGYNGISSVEIPEKNLIAFSQAKAIEKIESTGGKGVFLMDTARIRNNIDSTLAGFAPLLTGLKGKNVVVGIIDGGIYWQHFDFKNPADSTTRIKYIWDQVATGGNVPAPYNYGRQWTSTEINNNTCTHVPPNNDFGHGTCVAGIAAGNSLSTKGTPYQDQFTGAAPEADIIAVRVLNNNNFLTNVVDAVDYVFKKADSLGKPCVINTSIGDYYGSHDGRDLASGLIDALITAKNGRVLVAAAGNGGQIPFHLGYTLPGTDSAYTLFNYSNAFGGVYFDFWADTANFNNAYFAIGCNSSTGADLGRTPYLNIPLNLGGGGGTYTVNGISVDIYVSVDAGVYHVEVLPNTASTTLLWRLQTTGTGSLDAWATSVLIGTSDIVSTLNSVYITDPHYRHGDYLKTMVSSWQNSDKVITVGNYSNRASYIDRDGSTVNLLQSPYFETVGKRFGTSSFGPTRDNRLKPDVMATGSTTICTGDANFIALATSPSNRVKVSITLKHIRNGGTSMASPIVAGIVAQYLQKYPHASYSEIKQALICTAKSDAFTGSTPNNEYGNGKVDGFAAIAHSCIVYGTSDTACVNYNPAANTDTGCVAKVYGVMDTGCVNYNPLANVSGGVCVPKVYGITDTACLNYNPNANISSGVCVPKVYGIMDTACLNYNASANVSGGICIPKIYGITDTACLNYNPNANVSSSVCIPKVYGITDTACLNYNVNANVGGGICIPKVYGVTDTACVNYNPNANVSSGVCVPKVYGVTDTACFNYNPNANTDNGACVAKVYGVMDTSCINYNAIANISGGTCVAKVYGITDTTCLNYNPNANTDNGACVQKIYGVTDTACLNYNPNANVSGGTCESKVYGITDTTCSNYNPSANVSGGICIALSLTDMGADRVSVQVLPNPFSHQTTFVIDGLQFRNGSIKIYNQLGSLVDEVILVEGKYRYTYFNSKLAKAVYNYTLQADGKNIKAGKLVVE